MTKQPNKHESRQRMAQSASTRRGKQLLRDQTTKTVVHRGIRCMEPGCWCQKPPYVATATGAELAAVMQRASRAALPEVDWSDWPATTLSIKT